MTLQDKYDRWYKYMRMANLAALSQMGINRDKPRTKQLLRIAKKARVLYDRAKKEA